MEGSVASVAMASVAVAVASVAFKPRPLPVAPVGPFRFRFGAMSNGQAGKKVGKWKKESGKCRNELKMCSRYIFFYGHDGHGRMRWIREGWERHAMGKHE